MECEEIHKESDSDSGDSVFITQHHVRDAEFSGAPGTRSRRTSSSSSSVPEDSSDSDSRPALTSTVKCPSALKKKRTRVKVPKYNFPFLPAELTRNGLTVQKNAKLHYAVMGGFLIGVRDLQARCNRREDQQAALPTIDDDELCLSPISEDEDGTMEEELIRVVKKSCFVVSSKKRGSNGDAGGEKHQRSDRDGFQVEQQKKRSKTNQTESSMANILEQNQTDAQCSNDDAAVCESNHCENNGSKSADPELLLGTEGGQTLKRRKKKNRDKHKTIEVEQEGEGAFNLTIKDQMSFTKDETKEMKRKKKKRIKNHREAEEEITQEANENDDGNSNVRDEEDYGICGKGRIDITDCDETKVSKKKKKRSKIRVEHMDETNKCLEASEKPECASNGDPAVEEVTENTHASIKKKKKKRSAQTVDVVLHQDKEEEEAPQEPAEGADGADLVTKKHKRKKKSSAPSIVSVCSETVAGTEDSECVTTSCPRADAEEKAPRFPRDPPSAEISTSLEEHNVLREKKKKKKESAERKDDEETHPSQSGDGIEVNRKKKRKKDTLTPTVAPHSAADVEELGKKKKKKRAAELSAVTDNDSVRLPKSTLACSSHTSETEQTSDTPRNGKEKKKRKALKSDFSALTVTHGNNKNKPGKGKRKLHNPHEDFLSED